MTLDKYSEKRRSNQTPEPAAGTSKAEKLIFAVQKHHASRLHYDFRLELKGVLKSWAIPKGPSMNPEEHRLALAVEDHPFDYKDFEGIIPKGQYGAGTVIIWDAGTYEPVEKIKGKKDQEHYLMLNYFKDNLRIKLKGEKLKGEFTLVRMKERGENSWILSKVNDKYATSKDIRQKDKSIVSGLSIEQMSLNANAIIWNSNSREPVNPSIQKYPKKTRPAGRKAKQPVSPEPMLATLIREPFSDEDWLFEVKFDGYRILARKDKKEIKLLSRKLDFTNNFPIIVKELENIPHDLILDGEVVVLNKKGLPDFDALQKYTGDSPLAYYAFDLLWLDGYDLTALPLIERRQKLQQILNNSKTIRFSKDFNNGLELFEAIKKQGLKGIVAKRRASTYQQGKRTSNWLKLPTKNLQDFVVGGWTESDSGNALKSMIFGNYLEGKLTYVGEVGPGLKEADKKSLLKDLTKLETSIRPFTEPVETGTKVHWVKPELVITVEFATWTDSGKIRKPSTFKGFRQDKAPKDIIPENPLSPQEEKEVIHREKHKNLNPKGTSNGDKAVSTTEDSNWPKVEAEEIRSERVIPVEGQNVRLYNIEKEIWEGVSKAAVIQYYNSISDYILPHLYRRPLSLHIKHLGPTRPGLYIKDMEGREPEYAELFSIGRKHKKEGKRDIIDYLVCNNKATLLYTVNLGCIDINPWTSRISSPEMPDYIVIDLDPSDDDWLKVIETAKATKEIIDSNKLKSFVKTSGKTGVHIFLPCKDFNFHEARTIAESFCSEIHSLVPGISTTEVLRSKRGGRLYLDPSQNDFADTIAAPYSLRPYKVPTVSTPLDWKEINSNLDPIQFTIHSVLTRLQKKGDLFANILGKSSASANSKALKKFL